jgi:hypothetical protein
VISPNLYRADILCLWLQLMSKADHSIPGIANGCGCSLVVGQNGFLLMAVEGRLSARTSHWLLFSIAVIDSVRCSEAAIDSMMLDFFT